MSQAFNRVVQRPQFKLRQSIIVNVFCHLHGEVELTAGLGVW
jgi:hypothetical protein